MSDQESQAFSIPTTILGTTYPTEYVTAMFSNESKAHAAAGALKELGFKAGDMVVASGQKLLENERQIRDQRSLGDRVLSFFPAEEQQIVTDYTALAEQGYAVIAVHVSESDTKLRSQVATTLRNHEGIKRYYYGKLVIVDL